MTWSLSSPLFHSSGENTPWSTMGPFQEYEVGLVMANSCRFLQCHVSRQIIIKVWEKTPSRQTFICCICKKMFNQNKGALGLGLFSNWASDRCCFEQERKSPEKGSPRSRIPRLVLHPFRPKDKGSPLSDSPFSEEEGKECDMSSDHSKRTISSNSFCSGKTFVSSLRPAGLAPQKLKASNKV